MPWLPPLQYKHQKPPGHGERTLAVVDESTRQSPTEAPSGVLGERSSRALRLDPGGRMVFEQSFHPDGFHYLAA